MVTEYMYLICARGSSVTMPILAVRCFFLFFHRFGFFFLDCDGRCLCNHFIDDGSRRLYDVGVVLAHFCMMSSA
jgi:hypothetical protein